MIRKRIAAVMKEGGASLLIQKIWVRLFAKRDKSFFFHAMPQGAPAGELKLIVVSPDKSDMHIAERIMAAFHRASADEKAHLKPKSYRDAWDDNRNEYHDDLLKILDSRDARRLADYLSNMHRQKSTYGVSGNITEYEQLQGSAYLRKKEVAGIKDILVSLAEALDILPYETTVPYVAKKNIYTDSDFLITEIEKRFGIDISPPAVEGGLFKLSLKDGLFDSRDFWSLYVASRIKDAVGGDRAIGEIGGGLGKLAFYAHRFGFRDYSIFDLPIMNVMAAWHLMKALPEAKITLYGEPHQEQALRIVPYWVFPDKKFSLVVNQDSMPEMGEEIVKDYLGKIKKSSKYFLSVNHEHQAPLFPGADHRNLVIPAIIKTSGGFTRMHRFLFWLRKGYVEELYAVEQ